MEFLRSTIWVFSGIGESGMIRPLELIIKGDETRVPLMHCRQLMNWVAEAILEIWEFRSAFVSTEECRFKSLLTELT